MTKPASATWTSFPLCSLLLFVSFKVLTFPTNLNSGLAFVKVYFVNICIYIWDSFSGGHNVHVLSLSVLSIVPYNLSSYCAFHISLPTSGQWSGTEVYYSAYDDSPRDDCANTSKMQMTHIEIHLRKPQKDKDRKADTYFPSRIADSSRLSRRWHSHCDPS